jgi:hypothetical protein
MPSWVVRTRLRRPRRWSVRAPAPPRTGTLALTPAPDTLTSTAPLALAATLGVSQAAHLGTSTGTLPLAGAVSVSQASQSVSTTGTLPLVAHGMGLQTPGTLSAASTLLGQGSLSLTQAPQVPASLATVLLGAQSALTPVSQGVVSTATLVLAATASLLQASQASSSSGGLPLQAALGLAADAQSLTSVGVLPVVGTVSCLALSDLLLSTGASTASGMLAAVQEAQSPLSTSRLALAGMVGVPSGAHGLVSTGTLGLQYIDGRVTFPASLTVTVPGALHGRGTPDLLVQAYDAGTPVATRLPIAFSVHPLSWDVQVQLLEPQAGYLLITAAAFPARLKSFSTLPATFAGAEHLLGTANLLVQVYDTAGHMLGVPIQVHQGTGDVTITGVEGQAGLIVVAPASTALPSTHETKPFAVTLSATFAATEHSLTTPAILVQLYDTAIPAHALIADLTVDPALLGITAVFVEPQAGHFVVGGGESPTDRTGTMAATQGSQTLTSTGGLALSGFVTVVLVGAGDVHAVLSVGTLGLTGTSVLTQDAQALSSAATLLAAGQGSANLTQEGGTLSTAAALALLAHVDAMAADHLVVSGSALLVQATALLTPDTHSLASSGSGAAQGSVTAAQEDQMLGSTSVLPVRALALLASEAQTLASVGGGVGQGLVSTDQDAHAVVSTSRLPVQGQTTAAQAPQTLLGTGVVAHAGQVLVTQEPQTSSSTGVSANLGTVVGAEAGDQLLAHGTAPLQSRASGLTRVVYPTEIHYVHPSGRVVRIVQLTRVLQLRQYGRGVSS